MQRILLIVLGLGLSVGAVAETKVLRMGQARSKNGSQCDPKSSLLQLKDENSRKNDIVGASLKMLEACKPSSDARLMKMHEIATRECKALFNRNAGQKNELDNWAGCTQSIKRFAAALQAGPAAPAPAATPVTAPAAKAASTGDAEADALLKRAQDVLTSKTVSPTKRMKVKGPSDNVRNFCTARDKANCDKFKKALEAALK